MEERNLDEVLANVINPEAALEEVNLDKLWMLLGEVDSIISDFERELSINYISSNFSISKHLCQTLCRGKFDDELKTILNNLKAYLLQEIEKRKKRN